MQLHLIVVGDTDTALSVYWWQATFLFLSHSVTLAVAVHVYHLLDFRE